MKKGGEVYFIVAVTAIAIIVIAAIAYFSGDRLATAEIQTTGELKIGDSAPAFALPATTGEELSLASYEGKPVVLYFNEGVACQPCWQQIVSLEKDTGFTSLDVPLVTISPSALSQWGTIIRSSRISSPILADTDNSISGSYGVLSMKSSMHGGSSPGHTFLLLDSQHKVVWIGDYPQMNMPANEMIRVIKDKLGR